MTNSKNSLLLLVFSLDLDKILFVKNDLSGKLFKLPQFTLDGGDLLNAIKRSLAQWLAKEPVNLFLSDISREDDHLVYQVGVIAKSDELIEKERANWFSIRDPILLEIMERTPKIDLSLAKRISSDKLQLRNLVNIPIVLDKAKEYLLSSYNIVDQDWGWDHNLEVKKRLGIIGTALGITGLCQFSISDNNLTLLNNAAGTLVNKQHLSGGWGTRSMMDGAAPVVHSTAYAVTALTDLNIKVFTQSIEKGINWLKRANRNGAWGLEAGSKTQLVTPTTLAVVALQKFATDDKSYASTISWLRKAQYPDGGWGCYSYSDRLNDNPTVAHTARAIAALINLGVQPEERVISDGIKWLLQNQLNNFTWSSTAEAEYLSDNSQRLEFKHAAHQQALIALLKAGVGLENPQIRNAVVHLLSMQGSQGGWAHELAPGHIPAWATIDSIQALRLANVYMAKYISQLAIETPVSFALLLNLIDNQNINFTPRQETDNSGHQIKMLWLSGIFFVVIMLSLLGLTIYLSKTIPLSILPIILGFALLAFLFVVLSTFRQTGKVEESTFKEIVDRAIQAFPYFKNKDSK